MHPIHPAFSAPNIDYDEHREQREKAEADIEYRTLVAQKIFKTLNLNAIVPGPEKVMAEALMMYMHNDDRDVADIKLWKVFRDTSAKSFIIKSLLSVYGIEWCNESLELNDSDRTEMMADILGGKNE